MMRFDTFKKTTENKIIPLLAKIIYTNFKNDHLEAMMFIFKILWFDCLKKTTIFAG